MQELACVAFLAESAQPVLADGREAFALTRVSGQGLWWLEVERGGLGVAKWAMKWAKRATCGRKSKPAYLIVCANAWVVSRGQYGDCKVDGGWQDAPLSSLMPSSLLMYDSSTKLFW